MNKVITAVLLLALTSGAYAQKVPAKKASPAKKKADAVAVSTKAAPAQPAAPAADPAKEIVEKLKAWDAELETLKADFTQEVDFREAGMKQTIEGNLRYSKPNQLRIEHVKPSRQIVVTDKQDIWIYKPEDRQVVKTRWDAWRRTQDQNFSGILDFGNYAALTERNAATVTGGKDGKPYKVTFKPRAGGSYSLTLTLSATDYFPAEAELAVDSTLIRTRLVNVEKNAKLDGEIFKFAPPKGSEVIEFKN